MATTTTAGPAWAQQAAQDNWNFALGIANRPYQPYGGQTVAGYDPLMWEGQDAAINAARGNAGGQMLGWAAQQAQSAGAPATQSFQSYLDQMMPAYSQNVINPTLQALDTQRQTALAQNGADAVRNKAFGGDRQAVLEANTNALFGNQAAQLQAQLGQRGYETALGQFNADQARGLQASGLAAQLAQQQRGNAFGNAAAIQGVGAARQQQQQAGLDDAYARFLESRDYPLQQLAIRQSALSGAPLSQTTTSNVQGNRMGSALGGALAGAGIGNALNFGSWGTGIGAGLGGLLGLFG